MEAKRTPLIELLERVPRDAVLVVDHDQFSSSSHPVGRLCHEAAAALEASREDAARLAFLASEPVIEGFVGVEKDIDDYASDAAEEAGRDEPNEADMLTGLRRLIDAAIDRAREERDALAHGGEE